MKKAIIVIVIAAMFGYAIYEFVGSSGADTGGETFDESEYDVGLEVGNLAPDFELTTLEGENRKSCLISAVSVSF
ncbi:hypothetical protein JNUCC1_02494 [Lentibacillus sp. JNUCC-1]|uniref:hypothetical protein n=1 Tax=Lentibacillus sp. JNUCC-1 TaxID=2654513 RepID=UPI001323E390|nr:hypothetical protein [Lentibacillus sp. JNUCC-1]